MQIRRMTVEDCEQVAEIEAVSFSMPWSLQAFKETVSLPGYRYLVAEEDGRILGYCGFLCVLEEAEIPNVCVSAEVRGRGIGKALMTALEQEAKTVGASVLYLEVRQSNVPARKLYSSAGFEEIGLRKNFYEQPKEDAILMSKTL